MVKSKYRIIVVGSRKEFSALVEPLSNKGCQVAFCPDTGQAMDMAINEGADVLVLDIETPGLVASEVFSLLRDSPNCNEMAFFFIGPKGGEVEGLRRNKDHYVSRPFKVDQLLGGVWSYLTRKTHAEKISLEKKRIEGDLNQISLIDLLQIFHFNHKSGELHLEQGGKTGLIYMVQGAVVNARYDEVEGEKAFYRLVTWDKGKFWFIPGEGDWDVQIDRPTDFLIIEGLRQSDELAALKGQLPTPQMALTIKVPVDQLPKGLRPATQQVLMLLQRHEKVSEVLDRCALPDLEILQILKVLLDKDLVEVRKFTTPVQRTSGPLLSTEEIMAIKERLGDRDVLLEEASAKLVVLASEGQQLKEFVEALKGFPEFTPDPGFQISDSHIALGDMGRLNLGEAFSLRVFSLPATAQLTPLWRVFRRRLLGVVSLAATEEIENAEDFFGGREGSPVVRCFAGAEGLCSPIVKGDRNSLLQLLAYFMSYYVGSSSEEESA